MANDLDMDVTLVESCRRPARGLGNFPRLASVQFGSREFTMVFPQTRAWTLALSESTE